MKDIASRILERLSPRLTQYTIGVEAEKWGVTPKEWLEAVKWLVKHGYAEAHNVSRDVVSVRQTVSPHHLMFEQGHERVFSRPVLGTELRPVWIRESQGRVQANYVTLLDAKTLTPVGTIAIVGYVRYEDLWLLETIPVLEEAAT